jgi:pantoate--beta-alanine ligase
MRQVHDVHDAIVWSRSMRRAGLSIGLVPTMGSLHAGHLALVDAARRECDRVAVSVFVNPSQFGPSEDLSTYPGRPDEDARLCEEHGVDLVLWGASAGDGAIYREDFQTWIEVEKLSSPLCGAFRTGHFRGVVTVVHLLFGLFAPHRAYFGLKDYQQARLVERMAADLFADVSVRFVPTQRDGDGLALSSRNAYLSLEDRLAALAIPRGLDLARRAFLDGESRPAELAKLVRRALDEATLLEVEYCDIVDARTLESLATGTGDQAGEGFVIAVAVWVGTGKRTRLIDNVWLGKSCQLSALSSQPEEPKAGS